tara:strand:+ start:1469 stop:5185 length:3717 start_codon:yes stop_codon:yes gene_type:complete
MALRFGKYRYSNIKGEKGTDWNIEIWKKDYADKESDGSDSLYPEAANAREFPTSQTFLLYWQGVGQPAIPGWAWTSDNGGAARHTSGNTDDLIYVLGGGNILESGQKYEVTVDLGLSSGETSISSFMRVKLGTASTGTFNSVGTTTYIVTANGTTLSLDPTTSFVGDVKSITLKKYFDPALEFNTGGEGFEITWNGSGGTRDRVFLGSECKLNYIVENDVDENFLFDSFSLGYEHYFIRIYRGAVNNDNLWWFGWVQPAYDAIENAPYPYQFNLTATDSYGLWKKKKDEFFANETEKNASHQIRSILFTLAADMNLNKASYGELAPVPHNHTYLRTSLDWWSSVHTYNSNDPALLYRVSKGFVSQPTQYDDDGNIIEDQDPFKFKPANVFDGVLKSFNTVGFLAEGHYNYIQPNNLANNTTGQITAYEYNSGLVSNTSNPLTINTLLTIDQSSHVVLQGSTISYEPSFERVTVNHKGGFSNFSVGSGQDLTSEFYAGSLQSGLEGELLLNFDTKHREKILKSDFSFTIAAGTIASDYFVLSAGYKTTGTLKIRITDGSNNRYLTQSTQSNVLTWQTASTSISIERGYEANPTNPVNNDLMAVGPVTNLNFFNNASFTDGPCRAIPNSSGTHITFITKLRFSAIVEQPPFSGDIYIEFDCNNNYSQAYVASQANPDPVFGNLNNPTPVEEFTTCENIVLIPTDNNQDNDVSNGIIFTASQTNNTAIEQFDLGDVNLGQSSINNLYSFQYGGALNLVVPGFRRGNSGTYVNASQLLVEEFLQLQIEPLEILQAEIQSADISPLKLVKYSINNDGAFKYYSFLGGTFKGQSEILSGEWFKVNSVTTNITTTSEPDGPGPLPPNPVRPVRGFTQQTSVAGRMIRDENSYGALNAQLSHGTTETKIQLSAASKGKVYDGQKLLLTYPDGTNPLVLTASGDSSTSDTQIDTASFTTTRTYPIGSLISPLIYDLTNVITGGGTPGGSNTQVQFNNSGAFAGTDLLKITGANELTIGGTNTNTKLNAGADIILGADVAGGTSSTIQYLDSGGTNRVMLGAYATNIVVLSNRASNGEVQIRANTSSAGGSGELTIATFKDTSVDFLADAELRGTNIGNIFDLTAYLTAVDFVLSSDRGKPGHSATNGGSVRLDNASGSLYATFQVPIGYRATHVQVDGSSTSSTFDVYACQTDTATATALTSSPSVGTNQALSSGQSGIASHYLSIKFTPGTTTRTVYGAKISLERI